MDEYAQNNAGQENTEGAAPGDGGLSAAGEDKALPLDGEKGQPGTAGEAAGADADSGQTEAQDKGAKADAAKGGQGEAKDGAHDAAAWEAFVDSLDAPGLDREALKEFGGMAGDLGLDADKAGKILEWGLSNAKKLEQAQLAAGREDLRKDWGPAYAANIEKATSIVAMLDRQLGDNRFKKAIEKSGACRHPDFARGLFHIAELLGEDSLGMPSGGAGTGAEETALEGLKTFFK